MPYQDIETWPKVGQTEVEEGKIRPQLLDSMVRFTADSSKTGPTKIKKHHNLFI